MTLTGKTVTYDGENHAVTVVGELPAGTTVLYTVNNGTPVASYELYDAGTYAIVATVLLPDGYEEAAPLSCTVVIEQAEIDMSAVAFPSVNTAVYNATAQSFAVENLPAKVRADYTYTLGGEPRDEMKNVGTYIVSVSFTSTDANYKLPDGFAVAPATFDITPIALSLSGVILEGVTLYINEVAALPEGKVVVALEGLTHSSDLVSVYYEIAAEGEGFFEGNSASEIGRYTVKAYLALTDTVNYIFVDGETTMEATVDIKGLETFDMEGVSLNTSYSVGYGELASTELATLITLNGTLPEGLSVKSIVITSEGTEYQLSELSVGVTYTVTVSFQKADDDAYLYYDIPAALTSELTVSSVVVNVAGIGVGAASDWNYANHEDYDTEKGAISYSEGFSYEMTLTEEAEAKLAAAGLTVTYKTYQIFKDADPAEVDGPVTAKGTYKTVAVVTAATGYEIEDPETEIALERWGVFTETWSPAA